MQDEHQTMLKAVEAIARIAAKAYEMIALKTLRPPRPAVADQLPPWDAVTDQRPARHAVGGQRPSPPRPAVADLRPMPAIPLDPATDRPVGRRAATQRKPRAGRGRSRGRTGRESLQPVDDLPSEVLFELDEAAPGPDREEMRSMLDGLEAEALCVAQSAPIPFSFLEDSSIPDLFSPISDDPNESGILPW